MWLEWRGGPNQVATKHKGGLSSGCRNDSHSHALSLCKRFYAEFTLSEVEGLRMTALSLACIRRDVYGYHIAFRSTGDTRRS